MFKILNDVGKVVHLNFTNYSGRKGERKMTFKTKEEELQYYRGKEEKSKLISLKIRLKNQLLLKKAIAAGLTVSDEEVNEAVKLALKK